jgi:hypothetical protein
MKNRLIQDMTGCPDKAGITILRTKGYTRFIRATDDIHLMKTWTHKNETAGEMV